MREFLFIIAGIWIVFFCWLFIPALLRGGPRPEKISPSYTRNSILIFVIVIAILVIASNAEPDLFLWRFVPDTALTGATGILLTVFGLGFSAYARHHLGKNWSSMVMIQKGHQLIRTGPYRYIRNPMYTGMLIAVTGAAIAIGILAALAALVIAILSIMVKIRAEEELLRERFGNDYEEYRREVRALVPWVW